MVKIILVHNRRERELQNLGTVDPFLLTNVDNLILDEFDSSDVYKPKEPDIKVTLVHQSNISFTLTHKDFKKLRTLGEIRPLTLGELRPKTLEQIRFVEGSRQVDIKIMLVKEVK
ncbi:MAG: hypothetical protein ACRDD8_02345 [Bacteroidales bacterium]